MVNVLALASAGSSVSSVDPTFSAKSKAVNVDAPGVRGRGPSGPTAGRVAMVAAAILGNLPRFAGTAILRATTISGTMVLGQAPVFVLGLFPVLDGRRLRARRLVHLLRLVGGMT